LLAVLIHQLVKSGLILPAQAPQELVCLFLPYMVPAWLHFLPRKFRFFPGRATSMMLEYLADEGVGRMTLSKRRRADILVRQPY
jgi:hypothetical protein